MAACRGRRPASFSFAEDKWELYNLADDYSQAVDLADQHPEKLRELQDLFMADAAKYNVLPLDDRFAERMDVTLRPSFFYGRKTVTFYPGMTRLPEGSGPKLVGVPFTLTAPVEIPKNGAEGVIFALGGRRRRLVPVPVGGEGPLPLQLLRPQAHDVVSKETLTPGKHTIAVAFTPDSPEAGIAGSRQPLDRRQRGRDWPHRRADPDAVRHRDDGRRHGLRLASVRRLREEGPVPLHRHDRVRDVRVRRRQGADRHGAAGDGHQDGLTDRELRFSDHIIFLIREPNMNEKQRTPPDKPQTTQAGTPEVLPRPDFRFPGEIGRTYLDSDPAQFPQPVQAPKGAPNILLILIDDAGFGQFSTFGGGVPSPTMDRLAAEGLRYNHFHTTALCSPTRAALITGRNHHSAAFAGITEIATGYDGYTCILPKELWNGRRSLAPERLHDRVDRQEPQHANLGDERGGSLRSMGQRPGVRLLLRVQWR